MEFSVIVCTYNRCERLERLLASLVPALDAASGEGELIVIDNNSTDATRAVVERFHGSMPVVYLFEPRQGKGYALNTGIRRARGDLLLLTDDDVTVSGDWIEAYLRAARQHPRCGWFGGPIFPQWPGEVPAWYGNSDNKKVFAGYLVHYEIAASSRLYTQDDPLPWGASMAVRSASVFRIGGFREDMGVTGARRGSGMDVEFVARLRDVGDPGYHVHGAVVFHHVHPERLRYRAFLGYGFSRGIDHFRADPDRFRGSYWRAAVHLVKALQQLLKGRSDNFRINLINAGHQIGRVYGARTIGNVGD